MRKARVFPMTKNKIIIYILLVVNFIFVISIIHKMVSSGTFGPKGKDNVVIRISILNGCGESGVAKIFADYFQANNYEIIHVGNADNYDYIETTLIYQESLSKNAVKRLEKDSGIKKERLIKDPATNTIGDVKLIIGKDYKDLELYKKTQI